MKLRWFEKFIKYFFSTKGECTCVITANQGVRGGKIIDLKKRTYGIRKDPEEQGLLQQI